MARIVAFEPFGPAFEALVTNVKGNGLEDVTTHHVLLAETRGTGSFSLTPLTLGPYQ